MTLSEETLCVDEFPLESSSDGSIGSVSRLTVPGEGCGGVAEKTGAVRKTRTGQKARTIVLTANTVLSIHYLQELGIGVWNSTIESDGNTVGMIADVQRERPGNAHKYGGVRANLRTKCKVESITLMRDMRYGDLFSVKKLYNPWQQDW